MVTLSELTNVVAALEQRVAQHVALDIQRNKQHAAELADKDARIKQLEAQLADGTDAVLLTQLSDRIIVATAQL